MVIDALHWIAAVMLDDFGIIVAGILVVILLIELISQLKEWLS